MQSFGRAHMRLKRPGRAHQVCCVLIIFALLSVALACARSLAERKPSDKLRVLFVGNSLTYANDLPSMIEALAESSGGKRLKHKSVALPDYGLEEHWNQGDARRLIAKGEWDVVVLQQGPSASEEGRAMLLKYARLFCEEIKRAGARPALYMVWPSRGRFGDFDRSNESYAMAAKENGAMLLPVGEAWRAAWHGDASLALYSTDNFHPSPAGSYLAALVIYEQLFGQPARSELDARALSRLNLTAQQARTLQSAATAVTASPQDPAQPKMIRETITSEGKKRTYYLYVPASITPDKPLIVLLHPSRGDGSYLVSKWQDLAEREGILLVGPDALNSEKWSAPADGPDLLRDVVEAVRAKYSVNPRRLYVFGYSAGSGFAINMSLLESEYFAATAAFASVTFREQYATVATRKVPFFFTIGVDDPVFPVAEARAQRDALKAHGFPVEWKELPKAGHDYDGNSVVINQTSWDFLKQHELSGEPQYTKHQFKR